MMPVDDDDDEGHGIRQGRKPRRPTAALPGTPAKIEVMRKRLEQGEHLYHPLDAKWSVGSIPRGGDRKPVAPNDDEELEDAA